MKKLITLTLLLAFYTGLFAQIRLDVEGDAKILGKLELDSGDNNLFIGKGAGVSNMVVLIGDQGIENTFVGEVAGQENTSGSRNSFFGRSAGFSNTTGYSNSFFGRSAGNNNTSGSRNSFFGLYAGFSNTTGSQNSFFGDSAGNNNTSGSRNSFFGLSAGFKNTTGSENTFFGLFAGLENTEGSYNVFFGASAGSNKNKSTRSTMLGYDAEASISGDSIDRAIAIGYKSRVRCHNCAVIGGTVENAVKVGIGTDTPVNPLHIVQPNVGDHNKGIRLEHHDNATYWTTYVDVSGRYNFTKNGTYVAYITPSGQFVDPSPFTSPNSDSKSRNSSIQSMDKVLAKVKRLQPATKKITNGRNSSKIWGFAAEEVAKIFPEITPEKDGQKGIIYDYFGILSIKAIQELAVEVEMQVAENNSLKEAHKTQNEQIANQQQQLETQQEQIDELKSLVEQLLTQNAGTPKSTSHVLPLEQNALLAQNHPNPFRENTLVDYFVPANVQNAHIQVTGLDGKVLGQVKIAEKGKGQVTIQSKSYPAGTYFYSLVLDGQVMETKQMVLAR